MPLFAIVKQDGNVAIMNVIDDSNMEKIIDDYNAVSNEPIALADLKPIERNVIPQDRYFRGAWSLDNNTVAVDMPKAREIHMNKLRVIRNQKLIVLDEEYLKADEQNNGQLKSQIAQAKQQLRDMPVNFDLSAYATPDELKEAKPEYL